MTAPTEATYNNGLEELNAATFTMKGNWNKKEPLPEEGAEVGDCWIVGHHFWARTSENKWKDYGDIRDNNTSLHVQFDFLEDEARRNPPRTIFRKVDNPDITIHVIGDFVNAEIAEAHAPKEGKIGQAYVADNRVFLWSVVKSAWLDEGAVGEIWEPTRVRLPHDEALAKLFSHASPGVSIFQSQGPFLSEHEFSLEMYQRDVNGGYAGTLEEWKKQNGDLNALLRLAAKSPSAEQPLPQPTQPEQPASDKGADARELLNKRRGKLLFWRIVRRIILLSVLFGILGGLGYWAYENVEYGRLTVPKTCNIPYSIGEGSLTATREFSYPTKSLLGFQLLDNSQAEEKTTLNLTGEKMTIVGLHKGKIWRKNVASGERGVFIMKPAEWYIITGENFTVGSSYSAFCNPVERTEK